MSPAGVALANELLTDGRGPFFDSHCRRSVAEAVLEVEDALDPEDRTTGFDGAHV